MHVDASEVYLMAEAVESGCWRGRVWGFFGLPRRTL
jgi:hypothetical protein